MQREGEQHPRRLGYPKCPSEEGCSQVLSERKGSRELSAISKGSIRFPKTREGGTEFRGDLGKCFSRKKGAEPNSQAKC